MSLRFSFALLIGCVLVAGLLIAPVWSLRVGLGLLFAALAGIILARLFSGQSANYPEASPEVATPVAAALRREKLERAERAAALLEATMNNMREGMLVLDRSMRVVSSNKAARAVFNSLEGPLENRRLSELTRNPGIYNAFYETLNAGKQSETKVELQGPERLTFDLRVVPVGLFDEENARGAVGVFFDITRLERLERVRQEFLSNVSHELRTPLAAILAFVETLEDGAIEDQLNNQRFLKVIRKNAERMHILISDILELSAIEAGTASVKAEMVRLRPMVDEVSEALGAKALERRVEIHNRVATEARVFADPRRLEQMLTNLLGNAIKFNRERGSVTIRHEQSDEGRERILVEDTGEGLSAEQAARIFERFYRADAARARDAEGTGLGLSIVKHLALAHGGEVSVRSTPGVGSTFTIELPTSQKVEAGTEVEIEKELRHDRLVV